MNAPQTRQRPAATGREVDQQIGLAVQLYGDAERSARGGYVGTPQRNVAPAPRHYADIARELAQAATRLRATAGGIRLGGPTPESIGEAGRIVAGCETLLRELRQAQA